MSPLNFSEDDKKKVVEFLNIIASHATFSMNTSQVISYFKLLAYMQQTILPKIDANVLEVQRVIEAKEEVTQEPKNKGKK